ELAHAFWDKQLRGNPEIRKELVYDLIELALMNSEENSQYSEAIKMAQIYVFGTERFNGWKGMFCNRDGQNKNCASSYLHPTNEDFDQFINDHEIFAGLASWQMGQYKSGPHVLPEFMWKYYEPLFTGEIQTIPYYEGGHSFHWPSLVKKVYAQEKVAIPVSSLIYKKVALVEELGPMIEANPDLALEEALMVMNKYETIAPQMEKEGETVKISTGEGGYAQYEIPAGFYQLNVGALQGYDLILPAKGVNLRNQENVVLEIGIREGKGEVKTVSGGEETGVSRFGQLLRGLRAFLPSLASLVYAEPSEASAGAVLGQKGFGELLEEVQTGEVVETEGVITLWLYHDANGNGVREAGENNLPWAGVTISLSKETETVAYSLLEGWNFVSFPVVPQSFGTASELMTDAARQGAYVTTVGRWDGSQWQEYIQRGEEAYGQDFPIEPGVAYMIRNHVHLQTWQVSGFRINSSIPLELKTGFNSVGIPYSEAEQTASTVLDGINLVKSKALTPEAENADLISRFVSGNWDVFIKRIYSDDNLQEYGNNFKILPAEGYFIKVKEEVNWTP
ncbi:MAG: hypothetical protein MUP45_00455, partial [Candidatus Marinimicrobia bacterium]|nr:hypothetical protein [Candidatus Neomarinimicrobiota bacterium]